MRDLRSALAYTLVGTRDCDEIHEFYRTGRRDEIVQGFYFNSWKGGDGLNADRLLTLLSEVDVGESDDPRLDRMLDFVSPDDDRTLFRFERRGNYDRDILRSDRQDTYEAAQRSANRQCHCCYRCCPLRRTRDAIHQLQQGLLQEFLL